MPGTRGQQHPGGLSGEHRQRLVDRQNILDPLEAFLRFNRVPDDIELRFRNTILTTLDSGAGTSKTMS